MLVGTAGTGKSVLVGATLAGLDPEVYLVKNVPCNYYTTSAMLQGECQRTSNQASRLAAHRLHSWVHTHQPGKRMGLESKCQQSGETVDSASPQKTLPKMLLRGENV